MSYGVTVQQCWERAGLTAAPQYPTESQITASIAEASALYASRLTGRNITLESGTPEYTVAATYVANAVADFIIGAMGGGQDTDQQLKFRADNDRIWERPAADFGISRTAAPSSGTGYVAKATISSPFFVARSGKL
jgi:hypothetical protein